MTREELENKIELLEGVADSLSGLARLKANTEINLIKNELAVRGVEDISNLMTSISLPELADMDSKILAASDATKTQEERIGYLNTAVGFIKNALGVAL
ncbi:MAG: hypothetical protein ACI9LM_001646 [Alteromonadaceae bacterium]|jgi:hypothetical protein